MVARQYFTLLIELGPTGANLRQRERHHLVQAADVHADEIVAQNVEYHSLGARVQLIGHFNLSHEHIN